MVPKYHVTMVVKQMYNAMSMRFLWFLNSSSVDNSAQAAARTPDSILSTRRDQHVNDNLQSFAA